MKSLRMLRNVALAAWLTCALTPVAAAAAGSRIGASEDDNACAGRLNPAGMTTREVTIAGMRRRYVVLVPDHNARRQALPVVLDFHGSGSDPTQHLAITGMEEASARRGFILVLPVAMTPFPSGGYTWNVPARASFPDDLGFVRAVLDDVERRLCVDPTRLYVSGFSGGARMASEVACAMADRVAALAAVGGLRSPSECRGPVPVIAFHGTDDPVNPYAGGGPAYWNYGVEEAVSGWRENNRCGVTAEARVSQGGAQAAACLDHAGAEVVFHRIEGAGHVWPGSRFPFPPERFGRSTDSIDATGLLLDFFERHTRIVPGTGRTRVDSSRAAR